MTKFGKIEIVNTAPLMKRHVHGMATKDLVVLHETVSGDIPGLGDIMSVEEYLAGKDYGIHGMTDFDGNIAWAYGLGNAIFYQCGGVNTRSIGIEQVSRVMLQGPTNEVRARIWAARQKQLRATARLLAAIHRSHPHIPLAYSNGLHAGITSHWDVSQHFSASLGHTDCWPTHKGGYYPILSVITLSRTFYKLGVA